MSRIRNRQAPRFFVAGAALTMTLCSSVRADPPPFDVEILPPLETSRGTLTTVSGRGMNDVGQVVGAAGRSGVGSAVYRFTPGVGMENLDPDGSLDSAPTSLINERGTVVGLSGSRAGEPFLYADDTGHDLLEGRPEGPVTVLALNDRGEMIGSIGRGRPYIYSTADGWLELSDLSPQFRDNPTTPTLINNDGDLVFTMQQPSGTAAAFVLLNGRKLIELPTFDFGWNVAGAIDRQGRIVGLSVKATSADASVASQKGRQERAYYFTPKRGQVDIHPKRYKNSYAGWIQSKGKTAGGIMARRKSHVYDTIFTYHPSSGFDLRAKRRSLKRFVRRRDGRFKDVEVIDMNDRLEFVGTIRSSVYNSAYPSYSSFLSRSDGLYSLQEIVDAAGVDAVVTEVSDINNLGQILINVRLPDATSSAAILTPSDGP